MSSNRFGIPHIFLRIGPTAMMKTGPQRGDTRAGYFWIVNRNHAGVAFCNTWKIQAASCGHPGVQLL